MHTFQDIDGLGYSAPIGASPDGLGRVTPFGEDSLATQQVANAGDGVKRTILAVHAVASLAGTALGAYHGYKRNDSVGWAVGWAFFGAIIPIVAIPVMFAQHFGERK